MSVLTSDMVEEKPITARLMVYRPVLTMMPAMMLSTPRRVCRKAVTKPEHTPAAMAANRARNGVAGQRHLTGHGAAQGEAAVGGQVCDVQDGIAQEQCQRHQGVDAAQLQRRLDGR
ncbi:MAG: hypothetical protein ACLVJH_09445 [Faecalibacterium prausnitzii]